MNCDEFLSNPAGFLRRVRAESGRIAVYEAVEVCAQALSEGLSERQHIQFVPKKTDILIPILKTLLWDGFPVRKAVTRKDWLYLEEKVVNILNTISWMGMLYAGNFGSSIGQWEDCLGNLCVEAVFDPVPNDKMRDDLKEFEHLSSEQLPNISQVLSVLPSDLSESLDERFEKTRALWEIACQC